jgi:hypothetical protein
MERGFVAGRALSGMMMSGTIAWLPATAAPYERGYVNEGEILWEMGPFTTTKRSRFPAHRCVGCKLVDFDYSHQEFPPPNR